MNRKPGFIYLKSKSLSQEIALSKLTGKLYCNDGVVYNRDELAILSAAGGEMPAAVHAVKKVFKDVEVIEYDNGKRADNKRERVKSGTGGGSACGADSGRQIRPDSGSGAAGGYGDYGLY